MPRFFFHIRDRHETVVDEEGIEFDNLNDVREEAVQSARQLMSEQILEGTLAEGSTFVVVGENGVVALEFPFKDAIRRE